MRKLQIIWRVVVLGCAMMVIAMTLLLWSATGGEGFTKYLDPERAQRDAEASTGSIEDLFADAGAEIESMPEVPNRFELGLAPSGPGRDSVSVVTIASPALVIAAGSIVSLVLLIKRPADGTHKPAQS